MRHRGSGGIGGMAALFDDGVVGRRQKTLLDVVGDPDVEDGVGGAVDRAPHGNGGNGLPASVHVGVLEACGAKGFVLVLVVKGVDRGAGGDMFVFPLVVFRVVRRVLVPFFLYRM